MKQQPTQHCVVAPDLKWYVNQKKHWMRKRLMICSFKGYYYGLNVERRVKWNITLWLRNNNVKCTTWNIQQLIKITNDIWPRFPS